MRTAPDLATTVAIQRTAITTMDMRRSLTVLLTMRRLITVLGTVGSFARHMHTTAVLVIVASIVIGDRLGATPAQNQKGRNVVAAFSFSSFEQNGRMHTLFPNARPVD